MTPILFDLDGTLIDVSARHYSLYRHIVSGQGVEALSTDEYWRYRRDGQSTIDLLSATPDVDAERFTEAWMEAIERPDWLVLDATYDGAIEIIDTEEKVDAFLPWVDSAVKEGLATVERVEVHFYRSREP